MKYAAISSWASPLILVFFILSQSAMAVDADLHLANENSAIAAAIRTNYAQDLLKRIKLRIHAEGKIGTGILVYFG